jgi:hypothetical protein
LGVEIERLLALFDPVSAASAGSNNANIGTTDSRNAGRGGPANSATAISLHHRKRCTHLSI